MSRLAKWAVTVSMAWQKLVTYRLEFVLLVLGPALVFFFVKYSLWTSVYATAGPAPLGGFTRDEMIAYQCYVLVIGLLGQGYTAVSVAEDIRLGRISAHLLYPFSFLEFHAAHWVAFQLLQLAVTAVLLGGAVAAGLVPPPAPGPLAAGVGLTCLVSALWFGFSLAIGLMAFWLEQTWVLRVLLGHVATFLSGGFVPLELYPAWLRAPLFYTPFPYMTWVPAKVFAGGYPAAGRAAAVTAAWAALAGAGCLALWRRGLRRYSGAGM